MTLQFLADGVVDGAILAMGAMGVTLTYSNLRFANFAHGEFIAWGAYLTMVLAAGMGFLTGLAPTGMEPFSVGGLWLVGVLAAALCTGGLALLIDRLLFRRLRARGVSITSVMASFGVSLSLRALLELLFTSRPRYFSDDLQMTIPIIADIRLTPDQLAVMGMSVVTTLAVWFLMRHTSLGRKMRAVSENPSLAAVVGVDVAAVVRATWLLGAMLASLSGAAVGLLVQIRPTMGAELLLPLFAAAILGGIGSVPGAALGALLLGVAEAAAVRFVGGEWRAAVSFVVLIAVLLIRPRGLFGQTS